MDLHSTKNNINNNKKLSEDLLLYFISNSIFLRDKKETICCFMIYVNFSITFSPTTLLARVKLGLFFIKLLLVELTAIFFIHFLRLFLCLCWQCYHRKEVNSHLWYKIFIHFFWSLLYFIKRTTRMKEKQKHKLWVSISWTRARTLKKFLIVCCLNKQELTLK